MNTHKLYIYILSKEETIQEFENIDQEKDNIIHSILEFDKHINAKISKANSYVLHNPPNILSVSIFDTQLASI